VSDGSARIDESLELGTSVIEARGVGQQIAVLSGPADYCATDAAYRLQVVDARNGTLRLSSAVPLPAGAGYGWSVSPNQALEGVIRLDGGPALGGGRLLLDVTTDPASVLSYDY